MQSAEQIRVLFVCPDGYLSPLQDYLATIPSLDLEIVHTTDPAIEHYQVVIVADPAALSSTARERLGAFVRCGGACLGLAPHSAGMLPAFFGCRAGQPGPTLELRLHVAEAAGSLTRRMPTTWYTLDTFTPLELLDEYAHPLLTTVWQHRIMPVALWREEGDGRAALLALGRFDQPLACQMAYRLIHALAGYSEPEPLGVALIGYGPIAYAHGCAAAAVPGLELRAICDLNPQRLEQARADFPDVQTYNDVLRLADDSQVDLAIIATPPNSHARIAVDLFDAGKHVVCEKPMCLTLREAELMIAAARDNRRMLTTHQNRRWDADFLSIRRVLGEGVIGEPFYLEAFVGGFFHPCDYWHSHRPISGGALYDWGAHYVDSILRLFDSPVAAVTATAHKRVWRDVTNADQERVQIRFGDGREAEFLYSEVAAVRKPKWYILGTAGALVGRWREVTMYDPDRLNFFRAEQIPVTEIAPELTMTLRHPRGELYEQQVPLVEERPYPFHRNLADHLLVGEPLAVPPEQSARVVAVLEAAARSVDRGGSIELLEDL